MPLAERPAFAALGRGSRAARIAAAARLVAQVNTRTAGFAKALRQAAPTDEVIAELLEATRERQRRDVAAGVELMVGRMPTAAQRDGGWALLSPELYLLLVEGSGGSAERPSQADPRAVGSRRCPCAGRPARGGPRCRRPPQLPDPIARGARLRGLEARVSRGHEMFIAPGEYVFEAGGVTTRLLGNVVSLTWTMVSRRDGETAGGGLDVLALGSDGRIRTDYQFIGV